MKNIKPAFLGTLLLAISAPILVRCNLPNAYPEQREIILSPLEEGIDWVWQCVKKYPEILYLADENVRKTEEGSLLLQGSCSEQMFGKKFVEFDRTIMTLICLHLIFDGSNDSYEKFIKDQPEDNKLSRQSFNELHLQGKHLLKLISQGISELEIIQALETALVLGDIGKSERAREIFKSFGAKAPDHDDFHEEVIQILQIHPELCPSYNRLTLAAKKLITESANLAHYGHITHIEGGSHMFSKLKQSNVLSDNPIYFLFDFFVHACDVAGALGHINNQSSPVYTESCHRALQAVFESSMLLATPYKTEIDAYNTYLKIRAKWLGLDIQEKIDRVLVRMGTMLRLVTPTDGSILKEAILHLPLAIRDQIIDEFDGEEFERTPTYMPALLVNLLNNPALGESKAERLAQAVMIGLPFITRVLKAHRQHLLFGEADPTIPLNFNRAAEVAKSNPQALKGEFRIDPEGNIAIFEKTNSPNPLSIKYYTYKLYANFA